MIKLFLKIFLTILGIISDLLQLFQIFARLVELSISPELLKAFASNVLNSLQVFGRLLIQQRNDSFTWLVFHVLTIATLVYLQITDEAEENRVSSNFSRFISSDLFFYFTVIPLVSYSLLYLTWPLSAPNDYVTFTVLTISILVVPIAFQRLLRSIKDPSEDNLPNSLLGAILVFLWLVLTAASIILIYVYGIEFVLFDWWVIFSYGLIGLFVGFLSYAAFYVLLANKTRGGV